MSLTIIFIVLSAIINLSTSILITDKEESLNEPMKLFGNFPIKQKETLNHQITTSETLQNLANVTDKVENLIRINRCGVPDRVQNRRVKRFSTIGSKWTKNDITWKFDNSNPRFYQEVDKIRRVISEALKIWSSPSFLTFREVHEQSDADIVLSFQPEDHSKLDGSLLSKPILAHAFRPGQDLGGDVHFSDYLEWDFDVLFGQKPAEDKNSFFAVALHELGHSLGLDHSRVRNSVMFEEIHDSTGVLSTDDEKGIQDIYGKPDSYRNRATSTSTATPSRETEIVPDKCKTNYDAIFHINSELFIFKGIYVWRPAYKQFSKINEMWSKLPHDLTHIDAAYQSVDHTIWFFIGRDIYIFQGFRFLRKSSLDRLGIDYRFEKIDAIFTWHVNKRVYIFSGNEYWRLSGEVAERSYPKRISDAWHDVYDTDTAFDDGDQLFFFKGRRYFVFDDGKMRINRMSTRLSSTKFMECPQARQTFVVNRMADQLTDVIYGPIDEIPDDTENIEKQSCANPKMTSLWIVLLSLTFSLSRVSFSSFNESGKKN